ncbi:MAG TPA: GNAT family N-acetyltransferase [Chitinophagaceae bacterium]
MSVIDDVTIRTDLKPGDIERIIQMHGSLYQREYQFTPAFEEYVAQGLQEFIKRYDPVRDRVWICEQDVHLIGFLLLMHRPERLAQLRYFILEPDFRGKGLGKRLMDLFMKFLKEVNYYGAYLWTTNAQIEAAVLYNRYGFKLTEEKKSNAFGRPLIEQRYDYRLSEPL